MPRSTTVPANRQRGSALITALFVIVIGGLVGAALTQLSVAGNQSSTLELGAARSRSAALAGLEWARYRIDRSNRCVIGTLNLREEALNGFRVTVSCVRTVHANGPTNTTVYAVRGFAQYARFGQSDYVSYAATENLIR